MLSFSRSREEGVPFCKPFLCVLNKLVALLQDWIFNLPRIHRSTFYKVEVGNRIKYKPTQLTTLHFFSPLIQE